MISRDQDTRPHYVYRCYDSTGLLLYVGCSVSPVLRVEAHRDAWWGDRIARVRNTVFPNRDYALTMERRAIFTERPVCNVKGRWHKRDPRADWTVDDYRLLRVAVLQAARGLIGVATTRLLDAIDREAKDRFDVTFIERGAA